MFQTAELLQQGLGTVVKSYSVLIDILMMWVLDHHIIMALFRCTTNTLSVGITVSNFVHSHGEVRREHQVSLSSIS